MNLCVAKYTFLTLSLKSDYDNPHLHKLYTIYMISYVLLMWTTNKG